MVIFKHSHAEKENWQSHKKSHIFASRITKDLVKWYAIDLRRDTPCFECMSPLFVSSTPAYINQSWMSNMFQVGCLRLPFNLKKRTWLRRFWSLSHRPLCLRSWWWNIVNQRSKTWSKQNVSYCPHCDIGDLVTVLPLHLLPFADWRKNKFS